MPTKVKARIAEFVKELGGEVISVERQTSNVQKVILLKEIEQGLVEVKQIRAVSERMRVSKVEDAGSTLVRKK